MNQMQPVSDPSRADEIRSNLAYTKSRIDEYLRTGEIGSHLSMSAAMAMQHAEYGWNRIVPEYAAFDKRWIKVLARIATEVEDIQLKAKEFEFKHWMGFCDEDVQELMGLYRKKEHFEWETASEQEAQAMRDMWQPDDFDEPKRGLVKKYWGKYFDRRSRKPLQDLRGEFSSTEVSVLDRLARHDDQSMKATEHLKVLMGGSAGRVLITIQDRFPQGHPDSIYGGASVTIIFDESSPYPRGGVQNQCGTRDEVVGLIQACIDDMPALIPDSDVGFGF